MYLHGPPSRDRTIYDLIGRNDVTSDETYYERGINLLHGFMSERFVDDAEFIVRVPDGLRHLGVLSEPASVCAKAIEQAFLAQHRLQVWQPRSRSSWGPARSDC